MIKLTSLNIPLQVIIKNDEFVLLGLRELKEYENGKMTNTVIGYRYEVVDAETFEKFTVKVLETTPIIATEVLDNSAKKVKVTFDNAIARPYRTPTGQYELSIKADSINIVTS